MTCTYAAMTRHKFIELGFQYDSIIMEESAQILEIETLIPMLLQSYHTNTMLNSKLQRVVLLGDHYQLPPIIKNPIIQKHCHLEQSLFSRFIRLGVPYLLLDKQGRSRPEIASLYSWKYMITDINNKIIQQLTNLPNVLNNNEYILSNTGFLNTFQIINVTEFQGRGETSPSPYFYQNLGEAEYIVATYQFMRLLGYPAYKISILTTYNGQKALINDILNQRCRNNSLFGMPYAISTVDQYQGQQNDYILLSLVKTNNIGHIRDIRRLIVAMSRAKLGLYIFCKIELFERCHELKTVFTQLINNNIQNNNIHHHLMLVTGESYPTNRKVIDNNKINNNIYPVNDVIAMGVLIYQMVQQAQHSFYNDK